MDTRGPPQFALRRVRVYRPLDRPRIYKLVPIEERWPISRRGFIKTSALTLGSALTAVGCGSGGGGGSEPVSVCTAPITPPLDENAYLSYTQTEIRAHAAQINRLAFSPDGRFLASAGGSAGTAGNGNRDHTEVKLWSMPSGKLFANLSDAFPAVGLQFSDDGTELYTPSGAFTGNSLNTWTVEPPNLAGSIGGVFGQTWVVRNNAVKTGFSRTEGATHLIGLAAWNLASGAKLFEVTDEVDRPVFNVLFDRESLQMAVAFTDGTVRIYEATGTRQLLHTLAGHAEPATMAFSPDGRVLATTGGLIYGSTADDPPLGDTDIKLWDTVTGALLHTLSGHTNKVNSLAFTEDGSRLVSGSGGNATTTGLPTFIAPGVNPFATSYDENSVRVWDTVNGVELHAITGQAFRIRAVAISPDGEYVAAGSQDNTIKVWRMPDASFVTGLFDSGALEPNKTANYVETELTGGQPVQRALPVSAELPPLAECTCNCVAGGYAPKPPAGGGACELVCVCVPVTFQVLS